MNVYIEGDKQAFTSKTAITKFKNELKQYKNIDLIVLQKKYIHYNYKLELINKSDENITIKIILNDINTQSDTPKKTSEIKTLLKNKIKDMTDIRKDNIDNTNLNKLYLQLKKQNTNFPLPHPDEILKNPEKYENIVKLILKNKGSLPNKKNNIYITFFKLLAEKMNINTDPEIDDNNNNDNNNTNNDNNNNNNNNNNIDIFYEQTIKKNITDNIKCVVNYDSDTEEEI